MSQQSTRLGRSVVGGNNIAEQKLTMSHAFGRLLSSRTLLRLGIVREDRREGGCALSQDRRFWIRGEPELADSPVSTPGPKTHTTWRMP